MTRENIPDLLAWFRLLSSPVILFLIIAEGSDEALMLVPAVIAFIAAWTDYFDGKLARKWNVSSKTGAFLDTIADKIFVSTILLSNIFEMSFIICCSICSILHKWS